MALSLASWGYTVSCFWLLLPMLFYYFSFFRKCASEHIGQSVKELQAAAEENQPLSALWPVPVSPGGCFFFSQSRVLLLDLQLVYSTASWLASLRHYLLLSCLLRGHGSLTELTPAAFPRVCLLMGPGSSSQVPGSQPLEIFLWYHSGSSKRSC